MGLIEMSSMEARMADVNDIAKSLSTKGKFIQAPDYRAYHARARALRAEATRQLAASIATSVRSWFERRVAAAGHAGQPPAHAA
jgi:hypothetical protein